MKKISIIIYLSIISILIISGCASIKFNPTTGEASYTRIGDQHIQGLDVSKNKDGTFSLKLDAQKSDAQALNEIIQLLREIKEIK